MITQKIELHKEPKPIQYQSYTGNSYYPATQQKTSFSSVEIETSRKLAHEVGMLPGVELKHKLTNHKVIIIGFNDNHKVTGYKGHPAILRCRRYRENHDWETNFTLEELLSQDFEMVPQETITEGYV